MVPSKAGGGDDVQQTVTAAKLSGKNVEVRVETADRKITTMSLPIYARLRGSAKP